MDRQQAVEWLTDYAKKCEISYEEVLGAARCYLKTGEIFCLGTHTPDIVYEQRTEFWKRYALATGEKVQENEEGEIVEGKDDILFRCAC